MTHPIALITGASRGLGRNMALHLAKRRVHIIGTYRNGMTEANALRQEIEALGGKASMLALDVTDTASFPAFVGAVTRRSGRTSTEIVSTISSITPATACSRILSMRPRSSSLPWFLPISRGRFS